MLYTNTYYPIDMKLVFATQNPNKAREIQAIMPNNINILTLADIGCDDDIPETADTLDGNARLKAQYIFEKFGVDCFADDTGLEIDALNGAPGVYSARYAGPQKNSEENVALVLEKMRGVANRSARFRTSICLIISGKEYLFEGSVEGRITDKPRGTEGFGYDPVFEPENLPTTFAQMSLEEKNGRSHRKRAFEKMIHFLRENS